MNDHGSGKNRLSFSMQEPSLRDQAPPSLQRAGSINQSFRENAQASMSIKTQNRARKIESGSGMVKQDRPFPELKPKNSQDIKKIAFDQAWIREQRAAQLDSFATERQNQFHENHYSQPVLER